MAETDSRYWKRHARRYDRATLFLNRRFGAMADRVAESIRGSQRVLEIAAGTAQGSSCRQPGQPGADDRDVRALRQLAEFPGRGRCHRLILVHSNNASTS